MMNANLIDKIAQKIFDRITVVQNEKNISDIEIIEQLKVMGVKTNRNLMNDWRNGKSKSFMNYMGEIAVALGVEVEDLTEINSEKSENNLSDNESLLLSTFKNLSLKNQIEVIYFALEKQKEEQKEKTDSPKESVV